MEYENEQKRKEDEEKTKQDLNFDKISENFQIVPPATGKSFREGLGVRKPADTKRKRNSAPESEIPFPVENVQKHLKEMDKLRKRTRKDGPIPTHTVQNGIT